MNELQSHYEQILRLPDGWVVEGIEVNEKDEAVEIEIGYQMHRCECPECGLRQVVRDHRPPRRWRHLDLLQYTCHLVCRLPRTDCGYCGVKTVRIPWADPGVSFTRRFEARAIGIMQGARSTQEAARILGCTWGVLGAIKRRAVARGLERREEWPLDHVALDEKHVGRGQKYVTLLYALDGSGVVDLVEGRDTAQAETLLREGLGPTQRKTVKAVAMDMWAPYIAAAGAVLPQAAIVHDKFHIVAHLGKAVDRVRRTEHRERLKAADASLSGTKYTWLRNFETLGEAAVCRIGELFRSGARVARAWLLREVFRGFWTCESREQAEAFHRGWHSRAIRSRLEPVKKVARMIRDHLGNILNYFNHRITTAIPEGINSKIQTIQSNARGFRSFEGLRINVLFYCAKLDMMPDLHTIS